jgi:hypothetical protein
MSEYEVNFIETFIVQAKSEEEAVQQAKDLFKINLDSFGIDVESLVSTCEIVPKLFMAKEKV